MHWYESMESRQLNSLLFFFALSSSIHSYEIYSVSFYNSIRNNSPFTTWGWSAVKSFFQLYHQVDISFYLTETTTLATIKNQHGWHHLDVLLVPSSLLASQTSKSISFHLSGDQSQTCGEALVREPVTWIFIILRGILLTSKPQCHSSWNITHSSIQIGVISALWTCDQNPTLWIWVPNLDHQQITLPMWTGATEGCDQLWDSKEGNCFSMYHTLWEFWLKYGA